MTVSEFLKGVNGLTLAFRSILLVRQGENVLALGPIFSSSVFTPECSGFLLDLN